MNKNIKISGKILSRYDEIISSEALEFIQQELMQEQDVSESFLDEPPEEMEESMTEENMMAMIDMEGGVG